jgi:LmbE family N-acetylglucosaminyl deacetylase
VVAVTQREFWLAPGQRSLRSALVRVNGAAGRALPSIARLYARDITDELGAARIFVLSPHPDDETLGCGATISRVVQSGGSAVVIIATDGSLGIPTVPSNITAATRREEVIAATETLGVESRNLVLLQLPDATLSDKEAYLKKLVEEVLEDRRPDTVFSPSVFDTHPDHAALGRAARAALCDRGIRHLEYLIWGWNQPFRLSARLLRQRDTGQRLPGRPVRVRSHGYESTKAQALACHRSQVAPDATLFGVPLEGTGGMDNGFLKHFDHSSEIFFPGPSCAIQPT